MGVNRVLRTIGATTKSGREIVDLCMYRSQSNDIGSFINWNCCSGIQNILNITFNGLNKTDEKTQMADWCIIKMNKSNVPNKFYKEEFLRKYAKFFNNIDKKYFNLVFLGIGKVSEDLPEELSGLKGKESLELKGKVLFAFKMQKDRNLLRLNLASLSFIRFLQYARYWFYADALIDLREDEDLKNLNNYEILQLASYVNTTNCKDTYHGLYYYKSPVRAESYSYFIKDNFKDVVSGIKDGKGLNDSFNGTHHLYDIRQIRDLFVNGEYVSIYNMLTEPVSAHNGYSYITVTNLKTEKKYRVRPVKADYLFQKFKEPDLIK